MVKSGKSVCFVIPSLQVGMERVKLGIYFCSGAITPIWYFTEYPYFFSLHSAIQLHSPNYSYRESLRLLYAADLFVFETTNKAYTAGHYIKLWRDWNSLVLLALFGLNYPVYISDGVSL